MIEEVDDNFEIVQQYDYTESKTPDEMRDALYDMLDSRSEDVVNILTGNKKTAKLTLEDQIMLLLAHGFKQMDTCRDPYFFKHLMAEQLQHCVQYRSFEFVSFEYNPLFSEFFPGTKIARSLSSDIVDVPGTANNERVVFKVTRPLKVRMHDNATNQDFGVFGTYVFTFKVKGEVKRCVIRYLEYYPDFMYVNESCYKKVMDKIEELKKEPVNAVLDYDYTEYVR